MGVQNTNYPQRKSAFVNASQISNQKDDGTSTSFIRSKTFDLDDIKAQLGTRFASLKVFKRKSGKNLKPEDRLIIFEESEERYLPGSHGGANQGPGPRMPQQEDDDSVI